LAGEDEGKGFEHGAGSVRCCGWRQALWSAAAVAAIAGGAHGAEAAGGVGTKVAGPEKGLGARPLPGEYRRRLGLRRRGRYQIADGAGDAARGTGGEGMTVVSLTVNGRQVSRAVEGRTLLVELLRDGLGLTGTHVGCDTSQCGACVVHLDGEAVKACSIFAADCEGTEVRTIEGWRRPTVV
jgi:ferredoxin